MAYLNYLLCVVSSGNVLSEKSNTLLSAKSFQTTCHLGGSCSIPNALNMGKLAVKIHYCALSLDFLVLFLYTTHMPPILENNALYLF